MSTNELNNTNKSLSLLGEFMDRKLENEFLKEEVFNAKKHIRLIILLLGILYFMFIIPDCFIIKNPATLKIILMDRIIFLALVVFLFFFMKNIKSPYTFFVWISLYEVLAFLSFIFVFFQYESPNFLIQSFGMMIIMLGIFLVPNRWIYMIFVCLSISGVYFILCPYLHGNIKTAEFLAAVVYTMLVITLMGVLTLRINRYKRIQYINSRELMRLSSLDPLTGIYNRMKFDDELNKFINLKKRYDSKLSLILFDFDDFKKVNDDFGHLIGDRVLIDAVNLVKKSIRETDIFARWGGEEFVILLPNTGNEQAIELAERLNSIISNCSFFKAGQVTCSFGVASLAPEDDADSLVHRADNLLYKAKEKGKNQIAVK